MKLLIISAAFPPMHVAEAVSTLYLARRLAERQVDVHVLTSRSNVWAGDPHLTVHPIMGTWSWREAFKLRRFVKDLAPDGIILEYLGLLYDFHPMITFAPTICKRLFHGVPFVSRFESAFVGADPSKTSWASRVFRKFIVVPWAGWEGVVYGSGTLLRDSDHVIAMCERHRRMLVQEWPSVKEKVSLLPPPQYMRMSPNRDGEARRQGRALLGFEDDDFVMAFCGYLYPVKGIEYLLQAFEKVKRKRPRVKLVFVGGKTDVSAIEGVNSYANQMRELATEMKLERDVRWTGTFCADDEEPSLYLHAADSPASAHSSGGSIPPLPLFCCGGGGGGGGGGGEDDSF
jgi:glycosyltransferase involved in cell wall biosynthesis